MNLLLCSNNSSQNDLILTQCLLVTDILIQTTTVHFLKKELYMGYKCCPSRGHSSTEETLILPSLGWHSVYVLHVLGY